MSRAWLMLLKRRLPGRPQLTTTPDVNTPSSSPTSTTESPAATKSNPAAANQANLAGQILGQSEQDRDAPALTTSTTTADTWPAMDALTTDISTSTNTTPSETTISTSTAEEPTKTWNDTDQTANSTTSPSQDLATTTSASSTSSSTTTMTTTATATIKKPHAAPTEDGSYSGVGSTQTKLAIALPIAIVGLLVIIGLIWFYWRRRRQQRYTQPTFDMTTSQKTVVSTSDLMGMPKIVTPEPPRSSQPRVPVLNVPREQSHQQSYAPSPASASARSPDDSNTELGLAVALPVNQRMSATEQDLRGLGRSPSTAGTGAAGVRLPFQSHHDGDDDDAVSVVSDLNERRDGEHDFDDLSSVSSFNDDPPGADHQGRTAR